MVRQRLPVLIFFCKKQPNNALNIQQGSIEFSEEKLKGLLRALKDYSNAKIVEIASYIVQFPDLSTR